MPHFRVEFKAKGKGSPRIVTIAADTIELAMRKVEDENPDFIQINNVWKRVLSRQTIESLVEEN